MFKLVGVQGALFAVQDTDDNAIDVLAKSKVCKCLNLGLNIGGITKISNSEFEYTEEYFPIVDSDESDYDEDTYYEEDGFYDEDDEYYEEDEEYEEEYEYDDEEDFGDDYNSEEDGDDGYYSDDFDDGFGDDYYEEEESTVNKLYSHLNEEQIKLLKRYYLWYSQRIFDEGRKNARTLKINSSPRALQKQQNLNVLRNQGGMWAYAGFIDMGYKGADYCTLGHPLRYVHLAWDIT